MISEGPEAPRPTGLKVSPPHSPRSLRSWSPALTFPETPPIAPVVVVDREAIEQWVFDLR